MEHVLSAHLIGINCDEPDTHCTSKAREYMKADQFKSQLLALLPRLKRYALTLTRSAPDADDLLQEACTQALSKWNSYDSSQPMDRWMFTLLRNCWISELRKRNVRQHSKQFPIDDAYDHAHAHDADETLYASQIAGFVLNLPSELSSTLLLVAREGYSYKEAAEMMQVPVGTVMSRVHRARQLMNQSIHSDADEGTTS